MEVDTLKTELRNRRLSTSGKKAELLERLENAMVNRVPLLEESTTLLAPMVSVQQQGGDFYQAQRMQKSL